jgi:hypothetical protein
MTNSRRIGLWIILAVATIYTLWLAVNWLPLGYSDKEMSAFVSRVWDVQRELKQNGAIPWWTPFYMAGSSYGLNHSQGLYLLPSLLFAQFMDIHAAVKWTSLLAIFAGALAMYFCARYVLKNEWAAALSAIAFMLHPQQIIRAAGAEHLGIIVFFPFMPLTWWLLAKTLDTGRFRDAFWSAVSLVGMLWAHNKMAFVQGVFLGGYFVFRVVRDRQQPPQVILLIKRMAGTGGLSLLLGAWLILPGLVESKHVKLLSGETEQLAGWQRNYAFKSLIGLVDRDGVATASAIRGVQTSLQQQKYQPTTQEQANELRAKIGRVFGLQADAPEKYAGIVLLAALAVTILFNDRRTDRLLFWLLVGMFLVTVMLATGLDTVAGANLETWGAVFGLDGVGGSIRGMALLGLAAVAVFLYYFYRCKLTTPAKRLWAGVALAAFLFLPAFQILAMAPFFKEIRAPFVFYDGSATFFAPLLLGFLVTDVLGGGKWQPRIPMIVGLVSLAMLVDYWPYQKPVKDNGVPARTLQNLEASYRALANDTEPGKTYSFSGRYFHLLGPMYGGKPQVYEAFYNWMCPIGTAALNQNAFTSLENIRSFLNVLNARYVVFDKTDPGAQPQMLAAFRQLYPVHLENEDFAVFRNETARPYISANSKQSAFVGNIRASAPVTLALAGKNHTLVEATLPGEWSRYDLIYTDGTMPGGFPAEWQSKLRTVVAGMPVPLPVEAGQVVALENVGLAPRTKSEEIRFRFTAPRDCVVTIAESWYPYWTAEVDGKPTELKRVDTGLMGIEAKPGPQEIVLRYQKPRQYSLAGWVSLLGCAGCAGVILWGGRRALP